MVVFPVIGVPVPAGTPISSLVLTNPPSVQYVYGRMAGSLIRIDAHYFVAGVVLTKGHVVRAAPIVKYMLGWPEGRVISYISRKRWRYGRYP